MQKTYYVVVKKGQGKPRLIDYRFHKAIYFLMDCGNRHAETTLFWVSNSSKEYGDDYADEHLPLISVATLGGIPYTYMVDVHVQEFDEDE